MTRQRIPNPENVITAIENSTLMSHWRSLPGFNWFPECFAVNFTEEWLVWGMGPHGLDRTLFPQHSDVQSKNKTTIYHLHLLRQEFTYFGNLTVSTPGDISTLLTPSPLTSCRSWKPREPEESPSHTWCSAPAWRCTICGCRSAPGDGTHWRKVSTVFVSFKIV